MARFSNLSQWLDWQQTLHPTTIDMGLDRVSAVVQRLGCELHCPLVTIAGTNGKGSSVSMLAAVYRASNYNVGCFTSPHIQEYNERITINGANISDEVLCQAFSIIDEKREHISLTYFEFSTLAAWWIFCQQSLDLVIMEVGLGGRLDAVNAFDSTLSMITTVDLDHEEWLGHDRESIGKEKAGIYRSGRVAICGDPSPPEALKSHARNIESLFYCQGVDFHYSYANNQFKWWFLTSDAAIEQQTMHFSEFFPAHQQQNLSAVLMAISQLHSYLPVALEPDVLMHAVVSARLRGRAETLNGEPEIIIDVAHNAEAVAALIKQLEATSHKKTHAVFSALLGKNINTMLGLIADQIDTWHIAPLNTDRAMCLNDMQEPLACYSKNISHYKNIWQAFQSVRHVSGKQDRILVFGSFYTVAAVYEGLRQEHKRII